MSSNGNGVAPSARGTPSAPGGFPNDGEDPDAPVIISSQHTLTQALRERRSDFTRPKKIRIKVGTWNVASLSGTERDIGAWFVDGQGVSEGLTDLNISHEPEPIEGQKDHLNPADGLESPAQQEARRSKKASTVPRNDPGSLPGGKEIGLYVLGLQEIVDINSATEALRPFSDPHPARKWKRAIANALPEGYHRVAEQQLIGLLLLVYASPEVAPSVTSVSTTSVGTGLMGYMGNKGAVTARIVLGETTRIVFINCHLAAGAEQGSLERRNWDASQVLGRTKFEPVGNSNVVEEFGETIGEEDFAFWFGDLNYRIETIAGDEVRRILMLHTRNEYDVSQASSIKIENELAAPINPTGDHKRQPEQRSSEESESSSRMSSHSSPTGSSTTTLPVDETLDPHYDPASLQTTISSLLPHDQLHRQMRSRTAFYDGWREGPITFLPTYKYDVGSIGMFDSSEKRRGPSWCDRILFRTRKDKKIVDEKIRAQEEAKRRDEEMRGRGLENGSEDDVIFDYDPETDGAENEQSGTASHAENPDVVVTNTDAEDKLRLDYYTSHQRVLSSDHKPLDAVFTLEYDAVDPGLKAKVHEQIVRELDKAENEGRPNITIAVDDHHDQDKSSANDGINFGDVKYDHEKTRTITIANTGRVPATFGFVDRPVEEGEPRSVLPSWLAARADRESDNQNPNPTALREYTVEPGDAINVDLTVHIRDVDQVRSLNDQSSKIEDVLVLRVNNGRDHFLPLRGYWLQSSFGRSLDKLIRIPEGGVRKLQHQRPDGSSHGDRDSSSASDNPFRKLKPARSPGGIHNDKDKDEQSLNVEDPADNEDTVKWSAPRELFRLTEAIEDVVERTLAEWGMKDDLVGQDPPWKLSHGWPFTRSPVPSSTIATAFNEDLQTLDVKERGEIKSSIRESLDTDSQFTLPPELSTTTKAELLSETLLDFVSSLSDGIITTEVWKTLNSGLQARQAEHASNSKPQQQQNPHTGTSSGPFSPSFSSAEDERAFVLDVLSTRPAHSVAFTFLTFMLARLATELAPVVSNPSASPTDTQAQPQNSSSSFSPSAILKSPLSLARKGPLLPSPKDEGKDTNISLRAAINRTYATIFSDVIIRAPYAAQKGKERKAEEERRRGVVEVFLRARDRGRI
ncbi:hypothetical protein MMC09_006067 [Bachmanniomyces sp. S44760]|nr:hypothetical protein [Bachmanniomyces sp. S44760]